MGIGDGKKIMGGNQRKGRSEGDGTNPTRIGHPPSRLAGTVIHVVIISLYYRKVPYTSTQLIIQHIGVTGQFVLHEPCHYIVSCIIILIYLARSHYCRSISIYKGLDVGHVKRRKNKNPYRILPVRWRRSRSRPIDITIPVFDFPNDLPMWG